MAIDIRVIVTVLYFILCFMSIKDSYNNGGNYIPDFSYMIEILILTLIYMGFWIVFLICN